MRNIERHIIDKNRNIVEAMRMLNDVPGTLTLFVVDENKKLKGTLTDGDIRRGFIRGLSLDNKIEDFMKIDFHKVYGNLSVQEFKEAREKGVRLLPVLDKYGRIEKVIDVNKRKSNLPLEAVIMAGGRGERLRPLTDSVPKPMLKLGDKPIIEHNIDRLISYGVNKIYISVRYLGQQIIDYFGDGSSKGISIEYIWEDEPLGTAGALSLIESFGTDYILMMNSDLFTDANFEDLYLQTIERKAQLGVASVSYTVKVPYGIFTEEEKMITGLKEKPILTNYANSGIYIFNRNLIMYIPKNTFFNITDLMDVMIEKNIPLIHNPIVGYWIDIGQPQDYANAQEIVKHLSSGEN